MGKTKSKLYLGKLHDTYPSACHYFNPDNNNIYTQYIHISNRHSCVRYWSLISNVTWLSQSLNYDLCVCVSIDERVWRIVVLLLTLCKWKIEIYFFIRNNSRSTSVWINEIPPKRMSIEQAIKICWLLKANLTTYIVHKKNTRNL